jgi:hypothetical protein
MQAGPQFPLQESRPRWAKAPVEAIGGKTSRRCNPVSFSSVDSQELPAVFNRNETTVVVGCLRIGNVFLSETARSIWGGNEESQQSLPGQDRELVIVPRDSTTASMPSAQEYFEHRCSGPCPCLDQPPSTLRHPGPADTGLPVSVLSFTEKDEEFCTELTPCMGAIFSAERLLCPRPAAVPVCEPDLAGLPDSAFIVQNLD